MQMLSRMQTAFKNVSDENLLLRKRELFRSELNEAERECKRQALQIISIKKKHALCKVSRFVHRWKLSTYFGNVVRFGANDPIRFEGNKMDDNKATDEAMRLQRIEEAFPVVLSYVQLVYDIHDLTSVSNRASNKRLQEDKRRLAVLLHKFTVDTVENRFLKRDALHDPTSQNCLMRNDRRRFEKRMMTFMDMGCLFFKCLKKRHT